MAADKRSTSQHENGGTSPKAKAHSVVWAIIGLWFFVVKPEPAVAIHASLTKACPLRRGAVLLFPFICAICG
jgi:hypothetical protein